MIFIGMSRRFLNKIKESVRPSNSPKPNKGLLKDTYKVRDIILSVENRAQYFVAEKTVENFIKKHGLTDESPEVVFLNKHLRYKKMSLKLNRMDEYGEEPDRLKSLIKLILKENFDDTKWIENVKVLRQIYIDVSELNEEQKNKIQQIILSSGANWQSGKKEVNIKLSQPTVMGYIVNENGMISWTQLPYEAIPITLEYIDSIELLNFLKNNYILDEDGSYWDNDPKWGTDKSYWDNDPKWGSSGGGTTTSSNNEGGF